MNKLFYGDNLSVLREHVRDEAIDLIYLDPPFNSAASYNVLFRSPSGERSQAQIEAFEDTWHWNETAELAFSEVARRSNFSRLRSSWTGGSRRCRSGTSRGSGRLDGSDRESKRSCFEPH